MPHNHPAVIIYDGAQYGFMRFPVHGYQGAMHEITHPKAIYMIGFKACPLIPALIPEV